MSTISFVRYSPHDNDHAFTAQLVECYREVFANGPWHEWLKCSQCQKYWGTESKELLASWGYCHCGKPLADFWPREKVVTDLYHEITEDASCWLALDNNKVIGFCWGYPVSIKQLEIKLDISLNGNCPVERSSLVAYQDEVGVLPGYRGRKIAKHMIAQRLKDFLAQGLSVGVVRTREYPEPSKTFLWYTTKLGYRILARYPQENGCVILAQELLKLEPLLSV